MPRPVAGVLLLALLLRLAAVLWLADTIPYSDYFYYHEAGRLQAEDPGFFFRHATVERYGKLNWWPPGYPYFLATVYGLAGPRFRVVVHLQALLGTLVVALVYALGSRAAGRRVGLVAALLVAVDPTYVFTTNLVASENLFAVLLALGLWLVGRRPAASRRGAAVLAGAVFGLATLVRATGLLVPCVAASWLWRRGATRRAGAVAAASLLAGSALVIAPWTLRNAVVAGSPAVVCFGGGLNFWIGHHAGPAGYRELAGTPLAGLGSAAAIDRQGYRLGLAHIAAHPLGFVTRGVDKIGALFAPPTYALHANSAILLPDATADPSLAPLATAKRARQAAKDRLLHGPLAFLASLHTYLLLAAALAASGLWKRLPAELRLANWLCAAWIGVHVLFWAQPRFRYPMEIPMALLAAWALGSRRSTARGAPKP